MKGRERNNKKTPPKNGALRECMRCWGSFGLGLFPCGIEKHLLGSGEDHMQECRKH